MADLPRLEPEGPHVPGPRLEVGDIERRGAEARLVVERVQPAGQTTRCNDRHVPCRVELPAQVVAQRNEVDEVVRMEVADRDQVDRAGFERTASFVKLPCPMSRRTWVGPCRTRYDAPVAPGRSV